MSATIFLVRHGRTALNAQGRYRGRADPGLDDRGLVEAGDSGRRLAPQGLAAVYSSPLRRAVETARLLAGPTAASIHLEGRLIDVDTGGWTGLTADEAARADPDAHRRFRSMPRSAELPGGERMADVESRMLDALTVIARSHEGSTAGAVSHESPIRLVIAALSGAPEDRFWRVPLPTASFVEIRAAGDRLMLAAGDPPTAPATWFCMECFAEIQPGVESCPACGRVVDEDRWTYERKLIAALDHRLSDRRVLAARILGERRSTAATPRLAELARLRDDSVLAAEAAVSLASIEPRHPLVAELERDGPIMVREALARRGEGGALRRR